MLGLVCRPHTAETPENPAQPGRQILEIDPFEGLCKNPHLLFTALLNLVLGLYVEPARGGWRARLQGTGSALVLLAPVLAALAFLREPWLTDLARPYAKTAIIASVAGVLCHLAGGGGAGPRSSIDRRESHSSPPSRP
jgi:hypothetical protein